MLHQGLKELKKNGDQRIEVRNFDESSVQSYSVRDESLRLEAITKTMFMTVICSLTRYCCSIETSIECFLKIYYPEGNKFNAT